jgi:hypothetical protein
MNLNLEWVAQVSLLRPGFLPGKSVLPKHPGLRSETWATHSKRGRLSGSALSPLSSRPKRTRISYFAALARTTCAVSLKGNRMKMINATKLDRKSGGAQWRDLRFGGSLLEMFFERAGTKCG